MASGSDSDKSRSTRGKLWRRAGVVVFALLAIGLWIGMNRRESCHVVLLDGYGTPDCVVLSGRVLEDEAARTASADRAWWTQWKLTLAATTS